MNEALGFVGKDAVLVVDDLHPPSTFGQRESMHRDAARLFRSQRNAAGRGRMAPDGTLRPKKAPRGLLVATGEDWPRGQSVMAGLVAAEIRPGDIDPARLSPCQADPTSGQYACATATFIKWLAPRRVEAHHKFQRLRREARAQFSNEHARIIDAHAQLTAAYAVFVEFLLDLGVVDRNQAQLLRGRIEAGLREAADCQSEYSSSGEPVALFLRLLASAMGAGRAHLASPSSEAPSKHESGSGWRNGVDLPLTMIGSCDWRPMGDRVGWLDGDDLYLDLDAGYKAAQAMAAIGTSIEVTPSTLLRRLRDRQLLRSTEVGTRETLTVRRMLEGRRRSVVHLSAAVLGLSPSGTLDDGP